MDPQAKMFAEWQQQMQQMFDMDRDGKLSDQEKLMMQQAMAQHGWNLGIAKVTEKPASGAGTATWQGVLQAGPSEVVASAPEGTESSWT